MAISADAGKGFAEHADVVFDIWKDLLVDIFDSHEFIEWLKVEHSWQLRLVGPPGCGKTTITALTESWLRAQYADKNIGIACIYFRSSVQQQEPDCVVAFLKSVLRQFTSSNPSHAGFEEGGDTLEDLRKAIQMNVARLDHAYLLVDDIDVCYEPILGLVEDELTALRNPKLSIMVTSRVPHTYNDDEPQCDVHQGDHITLVYWLCENCELARNKELDEAQYVICQACKKLAKTCPQCGKENTFYEPYLHVLYKLTYLENLPRYIARELEITHGDLGLDSQIGEKPPLSTLGRVLEKKRPLLAERLRDDIVIRSDQNIALARARLDFYYNARTMEDIEHVGDRLPEPILVLFEAAIRDINNEAFPDRELGLNALLAVAIHFNNHPFHELETWLQSVGLLEIRLASDDNCNLLRTLHATRGLLNVDYSEDKLIQPYTHVLSTFVAENYSEVLYSLRHRIDKLRVQN